MSRSLSSYRRAAGCQAKAGCRGQRCTKDRTIKSAAEKRQRKCGQMFGQFCDLSEMERMCYCLYTEGKTESGQRGGNRMKMECERTTELGKEGLSQDAHKKLVAEILSLTEDELLMLTYLSASLST